MCFIAVYSQSAKMLAKAFDSESKALDYLFWAYEDNHLKPLGIYNALFSQATAYRHQGEPPLTNDLDLIEQVALTYMATNDLSAATC